jgi:dihydrofolate reductase
LRKPRRSPATRKLESTDPDIAQQCLNAGLLDEVHVDLVPVLLGEGIRFFANLHNTPVMLENPTIVSGSRVTHLTFRVRRSN